MDALRGLPLSFLEDRLGRLQSENHYPTSRPAAAPIRPERHVENSIATNGKHLIFLLIGL
jgi:hypothetical protein